MVTNPPSGMPEPIPHAQHRVGPGTGRFRPSTVLTLLALTAWLGATIAFRALALPDEGRYAGVAWEMLRSGHWLEPTLDGMPFFHKPPMWYWLSAASMSVFGVHPWAARIPSLAAAVLAGAALYLFVRRWIGVPSARRALMVYAAMPLVYGGAQYANHDMLVAGFITAAILLAVHATLAREAGDPHRLPLALAFVCAGCGVMTKGLIGAVLPGLIFVAWCLATRRYAAARSLAWLPGWMLLLAVAAPWMAAMQWRHEGFLRYFLVTQQFQRYVGSTYNNTQGLWFYPVVLAILGLPWSVWLVRVGSRRFIAGDKTERDVRLLMAIWVAAIVVFFSLPRSKLVGYALPAAVPLAVLAAEAFSAGWRAVPAGRARFRPGLWSLGGLSGSLCVATIIGIAAFGSSTGRPGIAAWRASIGPQDRVLMIEDYDYDLPFYLRLGQPVDVATRWQDAGSRDDWRHELLDAAAFASPGDRARLVDLEQVGARLCTPGTTWVFGEAPALQALGATRVHEFARKESFAVWHVDDQDAARRACLARVAPRG